MEAIGAFALVVAGCGAVITDATRDGALGSVGISLVFGLIIMAMIYAGGHLSGAHYNPAVTIAFTIGRHFPLREAASYIGAQLAARSQEHYCSSPPGPTSPPTSAPRCPASPSGRRWSTRSSSPRS